ncbi:MAG TPA: MFS transporter, partial [Oceanicaulis sp.]|nr:MFS transporter [Oceanicaulis sp.]
VMIAVLVGLCAIIVRLTLPENTPPKERGRRPLNPLAQFAFAADGRVRAFVLYGCAAWVVQAASLQAIGFFVMDRLELDTTAGLQLAGVALTAGAAALIFAQLVAIPALKVSPRMLMLIGAGLTLAGQIELIFSGGYASIVLGFLLNSLGFGFARSGFTGG